MCAINCEDCEFKDTCELRPSGYSEESVCDSEPK